MSVIAICGKLGSGKTLCEVYFLYKEFLKGQKIFCNHELKFRHETVSTVDDFNSMKGGVAGLDELWSWLDSRASASEKNMAVSGILLKSRKRTIDIVATAQHYSQFDKRFRNITDFWVLPKMKREKTYCLAKVYPAYSLRCKRILFDARKIFPLYSTNEETEAPIEENPRSGGVSLPPQCPFYRKSSGLSSRRKPAQGTLSRA